MKIIYRPHRGSLSQSIREARIFNSEEEMKAWIVEEWAKPFGYKLFNIEDIVIDKEEINDNRIYWKDTRYVCIKRCGSKFYSYPQCIGMCATKFPEVINELWNK